MANSSAIPHTSGNRSGQDTDPSTGSGTGASASAVHNCDIRLALAPRPRRHGAPWPSPEGDPRCRPPLRRTHLPRRRRQRRDVAADLREFGPPARRRQPDAVQVTIDVRFKVQRTAGKLFPKPRPRLDLESERVTQPVKGVTHARANMHGLSGRFQTQQLASRPLSRCMRDGMPMGAPGASEGKKWQTVRVRRTRGP